MTDDKCYTLCYKAYLKYSEDIESSMEELDSELADWMEDGEVEIKVYARNWPREGPFPKDVR